MSCRTKLLGGGLDDIYFVKVYGVSVLCIIPFCLYWVKSIPPVSPSSPGLPKGMSVWVGVGQKSKT